MEIRSVAAGRGAGWLLDGFDYFKANPLHWMGITLIWVAANAISALAWLLGIVLFLVTPVLIGGLLLGCRDQDQGRGFHVRCLLAGFSDKTWPLIAVMLITSVGCIVAGVVGGLLTWILVAASGMGAPGDSVAGTGLAGLLGALIILALTLPLMMGYWFAPALVVFDNLSAMDAMIASFRGCLRNVLPFLVYGLVALVLAVIASLPLFLGWLVLAPMSIASIYISYKEIFAAPAAPVTPA